MKNKKAMAMKELLRIILITLCFFLLTYVIVKWGIAANDENDAQLCRESILLAAKSKEILKGETATGSLNCPRRELVLKKKDIVDDGKINQDLAHEKIAREMANCWYSVGEGKVDPFSDFEDGSFCLVCTTIKFDKALHEYYAETAQKINENEITSEELSDYFITSPIPYLINEPYKGSENYYEYIYGSDGSELNIEDFENNYLDEGSLILVKMYKDEGKNFGQWLAATATTVLGAVLVVGGGAVAIFSGGTLAVVGLAMAKIGGVVLLGGGIQYATIAVFDPVSINPFSECEECEGIGGLKLIPPGYSLSADTKITYNYEGETIEEDGPYCQYLVN
jgi:predicted phage tail protein